ncbi:hypothetical protein BKA63DRAFT_488716 [Paraphoma chrysanthemicola]|nr:hypothetical protein BKA63DRAFT_488716 [Paraphoma chrysanthemicola]
MMRRNSSESIKPTAGPQTATMTPPSGKRLSKPGLTPTKSPRNSSNTLWVHEQQKRCYMDHLLQWSLNHDSSLHFHGKISLASVNSFSSLELGSSVACILTDASLTDARQTIIIRLFPPQQTSVKPVIGEHDDRRDSMDPCGFDTARQTSSISLKSFTSGQPHTRSRGHYKLVVRSGAGWMSSRDYFNRIYFSHLEASRRPAGHTTLDSSLTQRSQALGPPPSQKDTITIRPLFHRFQQLPPELQDLILKTASGLSRTYNLCSDEYGTLRMKCSSPSPAISLSTLFRISKPLTATLLPHIFHSTDFQFGLTGFTNFLWQSGPSTRNEIRRLSFHFGKLALLHCIRWLAPDPVFALFEPPVATNPRSLQYFWRCQIQDLVKDVHLFTLTLNVAQIPREDIPMIVAIMKMAFGSVHRILFVRTDRDGLVSRVALDDEVLREVGKEARWREMCLGYWRRYGRHSYFFKFDLFKAGEKGVDEEMDAMKEFFDGTGLPMAGMIDAE